MAAKTLIIGDTHGCLTALETMADYADFHGADTIITLGDYVDRGPDSRGVIEYLMALRGLKKLITLRGNHEVMMERARLDPGAVPAWKSYGGDKTLESYGLDSVGDVPEAHWEFIAACLRYHETDTHFFVHANAYPGVALADQPDQVLYWEPINFSAPHNSGKTMICGHTAQQSGLPLNLGHAICIDTWVYGDGWLTCLDTESGRFWQTNEKGHRRTDFIGEHLVKR